MRALGTLLLVLALGALCAQPALAKTKHHKPGPPDLDIEGLTYTHYAFQGEPASAIRYCENIRNLGGPNTHKLSTRMTVTGASALDVVATREFQTRLGHGDAHHGCGHGESANLALPLGAYDMVICAHTHGEPRARTHNDCFHCTKCFFVVKREWTGTASGDISFQENDVSGRQTTVNYQTSATNGTGCTAAGGITVAGSGGELKLDYAHGFYDLEGRIPDLTKLPTVITCPNTGSVNSFYFAQDPFVTNGAQHNGLAFGQTSLAGLYQGTFTAGTGELNWTLQ